MACQVPDALLKVLPEERSARVRLNSDLAVLDDRRFFIRTVMDVPIAGSAEAFSWGVWVELSEGDFSTYVKTSENNAAGISCQGQLANSLPPYPGCLGLPVSVKPRAANLRPQIFPADSGSRLATHFSEGMPEDEAMQGLAFMVHMLSNQ